MPGAVGGRCGAAAARPCGIFARRCGEASPGWCRVLSVVGAALLRLVGAGIFARRCGDLRSSVPMLPLVGAAPLRLVGAAARVHSTMRSRVHSTRRSRVAPTEGVGNFVCGA